MLVLVLMMSVGTMAQDRIETLLGQFAKHADATTANQFFDELQKQHFIDEDVKFAATTPADSLRQQVCYWAAEWLYDQQQYEEAEQYALKALMKYHPSNPEKADCLNTLGCIYLRLGNFKQAAHYAGQSVEIELRSGDDDRISSSLNTLAGIYMAAYQPAEAEQIILQALEHANRADNPGRKAIILGMASEIYHTLGNDQKALSYAEQAYEIEKQLDRKPKMDIRLSQKGSALLGLHRYKEAENIFRDILPRLKAAGNYHSYAIVLNYLGTALLGQERQREAIPCYREAVALFSKMGDLYNEIHSHRGLYESYWKLNPDSAKAELDRWDLLKDSLYTHASAEALSRYNAELGNSLLQRQNAEECRAHQRTIIIGIAIILLIVAASLIVIRSIRCRQQRQMQALVHEIDQLRQISDVQARQQPSATEKDANKPQPAGNEVPRPDNDEARQFLMRVIEVVNQMMPTGSVGVEQIASELNMSVQTFRRRLQDAAGQSPKAYVQAIQMERAAQLLRESRDMPVSRIANLCGFDDTSTFSHTFKRVYGSSPTRYRDVGKP